MQRLIAALSLALLLGLVTLAATTTYTIPVERKASFDNPRPAPHAYDCEFSGGLATGWTNYTTSTAMTEGVVSPVSTASGNPIYDFTTWPSWVLLQSDETSGVIYGFKRDITLDTDATIFFRLMHTIKDSGAGEGYVLLSLGNKSDSDEFVGFGLSSETGGGIMRLYEGVNNNGSVSYGVYDWPNDFTYPVANLYFQLVKAGDVYHFYVYTGDCGSPRYLGSRTKTGVTTLDEVRLWSVTSDDSPRVVSGFDFFRYYPSATFALVNQ